MKSECEGSFEDCKTLKAMIHQKAVKRMETSSGDDQFTDRQLIRED
jgi:hypothetical protein